MDLRLGIEVAAPSDTAWRQLTDLSCWPRWGPTIRAARLDDGATRLSAGATGAVQTAVGVWLPFRVDELSVGTGRREWSWHVAGVPATDHVVVTRGPSRCRIEIGVPWWAASYLGVVGIGLARIRGLAQDEARTTP